MGEFALHGTVFQVPFDQAFRYISDPLKLPEWTNAFKQVKNGRARMETPAGAVDIALRVEASREQGTIDWYMTFPGGNVERAASRLVERGSDSCLYSFMLMPPVEALEKLEGTLETQAGILKTELGHLKRNLEQK